MFKYIGLILKFRDIANIYKEETGKNKEWWLSRTFIGSLVAFLSTIATVLWGVEFDEEGVKVIGDSIFQIISAAVAIYGIILTFIGQWKKNQKA